MKYIFFGTPRFAVTVLQNLIAADFPPVAIVCAPDKPVGRRQILTPPPVKQFILDNGSDIDILQPETLKNNGALVEKLNSYGADVFVLAAYGKIVPKEIFSIPPHGTVVVHPSLLPKYRGATPIQSAIIAGEKKTGTTLFIMDEEVDHGPIIAQKDTDMDEKNYLQLGDGLANISADLLIHALPNYLPGIIIPKPQDHSAATLTKKFSAEDGFVDLKNEDALSVIRKIRALNPEPGIWIRWNDKRVKLLDAELENGKLHLKKIQVEGKMPTDTIPPDLR